MIEKENGAIIGEDTRTAIKEFVDNYDRVKETYGLDF